MKKIFLFAAAIATLGLASCDIDNVENITELSTENFPASEVDGIAALAGVYENLNATHANPQCSYLYMACLASDDQYGGGGTNDKLMQALDLMCNYGNDMTNVFWGQRYEGINRANTLIQALPNTSISDDLKNQYLGEALFLRAYYYYELASMYGNVPLLTVPTGELITQGDVKVLWAQMLQDLRDAVNMMPSVRKSDGHVDKYTAEALLGRIWLFYTGFYGNGTSTADLSNTTYNPLQTVELPDGTTLTKQDVIAAIDDCVNNSGYSLVPDFRNLWAYTNRMTVEDNPYTKGQGLKWVEDDMENSDNNNPESMFAIKFNKWASWSTTIGYGNGIALHFGVRDAAYENHFPFGQGWGAGPVAPNLVNDWKAAEPNDMRRDATIQDWTDKSSYEGTYKYGGGDDFVQETDFYGKKWSPITAKKEDGSYWCTFECGMYPGTWDLDGASGTENFQLNNIHDLVLIRFAEVLLMQSELKEDVAGINKVRARAGLDPISSYSLTALQNERRWELACEGIRWNDIRRWHIASVVLAKQENQPVYYCGKPATNDPHNGGYSKRYTETAGFQKMPDSQVSLGSVVQNDGWKDASSEYTGW
ncbi:MAG: RagB/SusD family nutrient uptake outer membrane protein [Prevotella sp.]|nr:RagB/SusD family nutrient uptake outer membrane protein [Prevotella sp.]MBR5929824.1 RagB/SusD family nutrient uptake outer membrane protein [Prevotella sp.]